MNMQKLDPKNIESIQALTPLQEGMLFHYLKDPGSDNYFEQLYLDISGTIDLHRFEAAWAQVIKQNEMLRTLFRWEKIKNPTQVTLKHYAFKYSFLDYSEQEDSNLKKEDVWEREIKARDRKDHFDLRQVPFRVTLCKISHERFGILISNHHILYDGWSNGILLKEFFGAYNRLCEDNQIPAAPLHKIRFEEFVKWGRQLDRKKQEKYWRNYLEGLESGTQIPVKGMIFDEKGSSVETGHPDRSGAGKWIGFLERKRMEAFAKSGKTTLASTFYAAWGILLQKYNGSDDVVFGTTVSGRTSSIKGIEDIVGLFINTIPLRVQSSSGQNVTDLVRKVAKELQEREAHENTPLVDIKEYSDIAADSELFDSLVVIENYPLDQGALEEGSPLTINACRVEEKTHYDLTLAVLLFDENQVEVDFIYNEDRFSRPVIERLANHYFGILAGMASRPDQLPSDIPMVTEQERQSLLIEFNNRPEDYCSDKTIAQIFEEQAERTPENTALVGNWQESSRDAELITLTYRQLNQMAGRVARCLVEKGVGESGTDYVGIITGRTLEMIIGILGILKSGAAYAPLNPKAPASRSHYILQQCDVSLLIASHLDSENVNELISDHQIETLYLKAPEEGGLLDPSVEPLCVGEKGNYPKGAAESIAYVIFTSGSTGNPKGVPIAHANFSPLVHWGFRQLGLGSSDRTVQNLSYYFDWSVWEIFVTLGSGASLFMVRDEIMLDAEAYADFLDDNKISVLHITPTQYSYLANLGRVFESMRYLCIGAEKLTYDLLMRSIRSVPSQCRVFNMYGPTEATIMAAVLDVNRDYVSRYRQLSSIPIGNPIANTELLVLDPNMNVCPLYVEGELYIGGDSLSAGYLKDTDRTIEAFIENPFTEIRGNRLYKTGDRVRWLPDGTIEFLGRRDHQVKIRGFRIELGEIENQLLNSEKVKEAVVTSGEYENHENYICAYVVPTEAGIDSDNETETVEFVNQLRDHLTGLIPAYMVPAHFVLLEQLPLNPNGKVDLKALPEPGVGIRGVAYVAPRNTIEETMVEIWSGVLEMDKGDIGIDDGFFQLGGHSLKATRLISRIHKALDVVIPLPEFFKNPTIRSLSNLIEDADTDVFKTIEPVEHLPYYPLSSVQKRLYILQQKNVHSTGYHISAAMELEGIIDTNRLTGTFKDLIARHESLRTSFQLIDGEPVQVISDNVDFDIQHFDLAAGDVESAEKTVAGFIRPFDLGMAPLLRVGLIKKLPDIPEGGPFHILVVDMHHIISDGTSMAVLAREFMALYSGETLPPLRIQYKDYSNWLEGIRQSETMQKQAEFWKAQFNDEIIHADLPADFRRPALPTFAGHQTHFHVGRLETDALNKLAERENSTLYMVLLAAVTILISKLSGREDIVVGTPVAGRRHDDLNGMIGMLVNTLALRNFPRGNMTVHNFLLEVANRAGEAFENQEYLYEDLIENLPFKTDAGRNPLFDVMFAFQNMDMPSLEIPGLRLTPLPYNTTVSKFDMTFMVEMANGSLDVTVEYSTELFKEYTVRRIISYLNRTISDLPSVLPQTIGSIEIITPEEKQEILFDFNKFDPEYPNNRTIHGLFEDQVERTPNAIALVAHDNSKSLTYRQLKERTDQLARYLLVRGVENNEIIGLMVGRTIEMIIGILGILKAGCAYVPLNPKAPSTRSVYIMEECGAGLLLTTRESSVTMPNDIERFAHKEGMIYLEEEPYRPAAGLTTPQPLPMRNDASVLAYVIFTSGSTGKPKGVPITHSNFCPLVHWGYKYVGLSSHDRVVQNLSYYFDWSVWEIFISLTSGSELYMVQEETLLNPPIYADFIDQNRITTIHITPTQYSYLANLGRKLESLTHLCIGAERLTYDLLIRSIRSVTADCRVYNMYGPTEATIMAAVLEIDRSKLDEYKNLSSIPIGKTLGNTELLVLDKDMQMCPVNVPGELYIAGDALSQGYLNDAAKTEAAFVENPFNEVRGNRLYKTGDRVRWLPDGTVEFLTRFDHQVKIRGYRIELGEIENHIMAHNSVKEAVVTAGEHLNGDRYLCAYIVPVESVDSLDSNKGDFSLPALREFLAEQLPGYMIPAHFVTLDSLPLNPNGKVDLKSLPTPDISATGVEYVSPRNSRERQLTAIWAEVIGIPEESLGIDTNFFEAGGHSLKVTRLVASIHKKMKIQLRLSDVFKHPTIRGLSTFMEETTQESIFSRIEPVEKKEWYPLTSAQNRVFILQQMDLDSVAYNIANVSILDGPLDKEMFSTTFLKLIQRHESLRTSFRLLEGEPIQQIHDTVHFEIEHHFGDGDHIGANIPETALEKINQFVRPFDLSEPPLIRVGLIKLNQNKHVLMLDIHHIVADGVSMDVVRREFAALYRNDVLPSFAVQYKDFASWLNQIIQSGEIASKENYWLDRFKGEIPVLNLPTDFPRPDVKRYQGARFDFSLPKQDKLRLRRLTLETGTTIFMVLLTTLNLLLSRLSGQDDIIVGTPIAGRPHADLENTIGMFVNTLALRYFPTPEKTAAELLAEIKEDTVKAFENQEYPFEDLVEKVLPVQDLSRNPLFDVMLSVQNLGFSDQVEQSTGITITPYHFDTGTAKFDLVLNAIEDGDILDVYFFYSTTLFTEETIRRFSGYFCRILSGILDDPQIAVIDIELLSEKQKQQLLYGFNDTSVNYPSDKTLHQLFEEQVERTPDEMALVGINGVSGEKRERIAYRELNRRANVMARLLREKNVHPDSVVALVTERSVEMIVCILAVLKAGGAYLPIDPGYPDDRKRFMLEDSQPVVLLTNLESGFYADGINGEKSVEVINVADVSLYTEGEYTNLDHINETGHLAYVIYTSGSTGKPKGVLVEHRNAVNTVTWWARSYEVGIGTNVLQMSDYTFDPSVNQIFATLLHGGALFLIAKEQLFDVDSLRTFIQDNCIHILNFVPLILNELLSRGPFLESIRAVLSGGERLDRTIKDNILAKGYRLVNQYGPTETSIDALAGECTEGEVSLGTPIANTRCYVLDSHRHLVPVGAAGELYIGGDGVTRGYLRRDDLTAEKFVENPFIHGERLYRSGDLVRRMPDGTFRFLGRIDYQVKVRGYRIELGEIEARLENHPQIKEAIVIDHTDESGEKFLGAYIVPQPVEASELEDLPFRVVSLAELSGSSSYLLPPLGIESSDESEAASSNTNQSIVQRFENRAIQRGDQIALTTGNRMMSFRNLNTYAEGIARSVNENYDDRYRLTFRERIRYSRQLKLDGWGVNGQERLKQATVLVVGAGGVGSPTLQQLALSGIGTIIICDFDELDLSNLNRQILHDESRIGLNKAVSAEMTIKRINPNVNVIVHQEMVTRENIACLAGSAEIVFDCVDDLTTKFILSEFAVARGIPHVVAVMIELSSYVMILNAPQTPCYHCMTDRKKLEEIEEIKKTLHNYQNESFPVSASSLFTCTGFSVNEAVKYLLGMDNVGYNKYFLFNQSGSLRFSETKGFNMNTYSYSDHFRAISLKQGMDWEKGWSGRLLEELSITPDPQCPVCSAGNREKIIGMYDLSNCQKNESPVQEISRSDSSNDSQSPVSRTDLPSTVALLTDDPIYKAAGVLGILKSGKAFLFLNAEVGDERLEFEVMESGCRVILTDNKHAQLAVAIRNRVNKDLPIVNIEEIPYTEPLQPLNIPLDSQRASCLEFRFDTDSESGMSESRLREFLERQVPEYMVPTFFTIIDEIPLTPNGKIDRRALPKPKALFAEDRYEPPSNPKEDRLAAIWSDVLSIPKENIGVNTNFFELGGHSLKATRLISSIYKEFNTKILLSEVFKAPTIREMAECIDTGISDTFTTIEAAPKADYYPLSSPQRRIYIVQKSDVASTGYNMPVALIMDGSIGKERLEDIFRKVIQRHESLRTSFKIVGGEPVQVVHDQVDFDVVYGRQVGFGIINSVIGEFIRPFDLSKAPLIRVELAILAAEKHLLLVDMHHIISDGASLQIFVREFMTLFEGKELPPVVVQYKDFAVWRQRPEEQSAAKKREAHWLERFHGDLPRLTLPYDFQRPTERSFEGAVVEFLLPLEETDSLKALAQEEEVTLYMVLISIYYVLLGRLSGQEDIIAGTPVMGREREDLHGTIGMFVNTLALRNFPRRELTFREFLGNVGERILRDFENQAHPLEELVEAVADDWENNRNPLFDVMFALQNQGIPELSASGLTLTPYRYEVNTAKFDLVLTGVEKEEGISFSLEYAAKLFGADTIERFGIYYKDISAVVIENPDIKLADIKLSMELEEAESELAGELDGDFDF